jgi:DNA-binding transcriptional LysR family regulator
MTPHRTDALWGVDRGLGIRLGRLRGLVFSRPAGDPVVVRVSGSLITNSPDTARAAAVAGVGLVLTAPFMVADLLESGTLVPLLPGYRTPELEINAFYTHRRHLSAKVRAFIDLLVDRFAPQADLPLPRIRSPHSTHSGL